MPPAMGPPDTAIWEYPGQDGSWRAEYLHLVDCIRTGRRPSGDLADARAALEIVERVYHDAAGRRAPARAAVGDDTLPG
jgi:predicted dehydrogenase